MFDFLKRTKIEKDAANRIGVHLHRQIKEAANINKQAANLRIGSFFSSGYIGGFVAAGLKHQSVNYDDLLDNYLKHICNGIFPGGHLYESVSRHIAAASIGSDILNDGGSRRPDVEESIEEFEFGVAVGMADAAIPRFDSLAKARNLTLYLIGSDLELPANAAGFTDEEDDVESAEADENSEDVVEDDEDYWEEAYKEHPMVEWLESLAKRDEKLATEDREPEFDEVLRQIMKKINKRLKVAEGKAKLAKVALIHGLLFGCCDEDDAHDNYFDVCKRYKISRADAERFLDFYDSTDKHVIFWITNKASELCADIRCGNAEAQDDLAQTVADTARDRSFPRSIGTLKA